MTEPQLQNNIIKNRDESHNQLDDFTELVLLSQQVYHIAFIQPCITLMFSFEHTAMILQ